MIAMNSKDKRQYQLFCKERELRVKIAELIEEFTKDSGFRACGMNLFENPYYNSSQEIHAPMYNIEIFYKPTYLE